MSRNEQRCELLLACWAQFSGWMRRVSLERDQGWVEQGVIDGWFPVHGLAIDDLGKLEWDGKSLSKAL